MKIGVCVLHEKNKPVLDELKKIRSHGFDNCQLVGWDTDLWTDAEAGSIRAAAGEAGVDITAFWCGWRGPKVWDFYEGQETLGIVPAAWRAMRVQDLIDGGDFAKSFGVTDIVTHVGFLPESPNDPQNPGIISALRTVCRHYLKNNQNLLCETGQETPVTLLRVIDEIGTGNVYINLDPANLIMYGKGNPVDALDVFGGYVRGVHAKDGMYPTDGRQLGIEVPLGNGKANFPELIKRLKELGYGGALTIEREIEGEQQTKDILMAKEILEGYINS